MTSKLKLTEAQKEMIQPKRVKYKDQVYIRTLEGDFYLRWGNNDSKFLDFVRAEKLDTNCVFTVRSQEHLSNAGGVFFSDNDIRFECTGKSSDKDDPFVVTINTEDHYGMLSGSVKWDPAGDDEDFLLMNTKKEDYDGPVLYGDPFYIVCKAAEGDSYIGGTYFVPNEAGSSKDKSAAAKYTFELVKGAMEPLQPVSLNTRYDEATFAMAHDSHTAMNWSDLESFSTISPSDSKLVASTQSRGVSLQLDDGIRAMRISSERPYSNGNEVFLCHGPAVFVALRDYLQKVIDFLEDNPHEVITIFDEGSAGVQHVWNVYKRHGFDEYLYTGPTDPWPTLHEIVHDYKQRLIVFAKDETVDEERYPGIHKMWKKEGETGGSVWQSHYQYYKPSQVNYKAADDTDSTASLYLYNHFFYENIIHTVFGDWDRAAPEHSEWTVGPLLREDVKKAWIGTGQRPNFVNVDFYQGIDGAKSQLISLVNEMNQVSSGEELQG